jgi:hypothetical protein
MVTSGAIYVRNPSASDPIRPITDQRVLFDLIARGERAEVLAVDRARLSHEVRLRDCWTVAIVRESLAVAPTGITGDFEDRLFDAGMPERLSVAAWGKKAASGADDRLTSWEQSLVGVWRLQRGGFSSEPTEVSIIAIDRYGAAVIWTGYHEEQDETRGYGHAQLADLEARLGTRLGALRDLLLDLGAHGDLRLSYRIDLDRQYLLVDGDAKQLAAPFGFEAWVGFESDPRERFRAEILRAAGTGPKNR